jgi:hypothetical protein
METQSALDLIERKLAKAVYPEERARLYDIAANMERGWQIQKEALDRLTVSAAPRASMQSWRETLMATTASDTPITTPASETALTPGFTFPANYFYAGRIIKMTLWGMSSTVITTPGTLIFKLRAGVGGTTGTLLVTSGTYAPDPTAASTQITSYQEFYTVVRATGTAAASLTVGRMWLGDIDDATVTTIQGNLNMHTIPVSAPATVNIDTTATNTWSATMTPNVTTGSYTNLLTILEALT